MDKGFLWIIEFSRMVLTCTSNASGQLQTKDGDKSVKNIPLEMYD